MLFLFQSASFPGERLCLPTATSQDWIAAGPSAASLGRFCPLVTTVGRALPGLVSSGRVHLGEACDYVLSLFSALRVTSVKLFARFL